MGLHRVGHDWSDLAAAAAAPEEGRVLGTGDLEKKEMCPCPQGVCSLSGKQTRIYRTGAKIGSSRVCFTDKVALRCSNLALVEVSFVLRKLPVNHTVDSVQHHSISCRFQVT